MFRYIVSLMIILALVVTAYATTIGFSSGSSVVTQEQPTELFVEVTSQGDLSAFAQFVGKGANLSIVGLATGAPSCSDGSGHIKEAFCTIPNAPVGGYMITVAPKGNYSISNVNGTVTGNIVP